MVVMQDKGYQTEGQETRTLSRAPSFTRPIILNLSYKHPGPQFPYL